MSLVAFHNVACSLSQVAIANHWCDLEGSKRA